jgi:hypothetical protein
MKLNTELVAHVSNSGSYEGWALFTSCVIHYRYINSFLVKDRGCIKITVIINIEREKENKRFNFFIALRYSIFILSN